MLSSTEGEARGQQGLKLTETAPAGREGTPAAILIPLCVSWVQSLPPPQDYKEKEKCDFLLVCWTKGVKENQNDHSQQA